MDQIEKVADGKYIVHTDKGEAIETDVVMMATGSGRQARGNNG